jgi:HAD superfamily hydrolase (TIGR01509 family)
MVKPNADIYLYLLDKYGLDPAECMFVDDRLDNIEVGEAVGIKGYLFDGDLEKLLEYLKSEGII